MEREVILTGIGGQGVQLAALVLARAAVQEGRHVMMLGTYGGTMRGGNTDSTVIVADAPIASPPIVSRAWSALVMHPRFWAPLGAKLRPGGLVVVNASLFEGDIDRQAQQVVEVPATEMATALGSPLVASMVAIGAFARATGLVGLDALRAAMLESVPSYRRQHLELNERALRAGFDAVPEGVARAWGPAEAA
jgi:2-oxoacid:acceptor oxidoreductase gamma subunit (pyruvate/2-ketoisovalerate family)